MRKTQIMDWKSIKVAGIGRIDRVVATFEVWSDGSLPFAKFKIKIVERIGGDFAGFANVAIRGSVTGDPEWVAGLGDSAEQALRDTLDYFFKEIEQHAENRSLTSDDFEWADPADF
jgi:hypothetical protein